MTDQPTPLFSRPWARMGLLAIGAALATVLVMSLYSSISSRKAEARQTSLKLVDIDEKTVDPEIWGKNFPRQLDAYKRTAEKYSTKYGGAGSEGLPKSRIKEDPGWSPFSMATPSPSTSTSARATPTCWTTSAPPSASRPSPRRAPACTAMRPTPWPTVRPA